MHSLEVLGFRPWPSGKGLGFRVQTQDTSSSNPHEKDLDS